MGLKVKFKEPKMGRAAELRTFLGFGEIRIGKRAPKARHHQLIVHEKRHWQQYKRTYWFHPLLYKFSKKYRQAAEVEAYKAEMLAADSEMFIYDAARWLARDYNLGITQAEAKVLLES